MDEVEAVVERLSQLISDINTKAVQDTVATAELYAALQSLLLLAQSSHTDTSQIVASATMATLHSLFTSKSILLTYALQTVVVMVYECIFTRNTPGYIIRNIIASLIAVSHQKGNTIGARECAIVLLGIVTERRTSESTSFTSEILGIGLKYSKSNELMVRSACILSLVSMVKGCGSNFVENYAEMVKYIPKLAADRAPSIRINSCKLIYEISENQFMCQYKFIEVFIPILTKGLEDEVPSVQDRFAETLARVSRGIL